MTVYCRVIRPNTIQFITRGMYEENIKFRRV